uniref:Uncharacterized protein LOC111100125 n=1 Tax=Crassostrea virginica TaxID=6565 RepID=A0A8B8AC04_CRAVI|nr:uncharacterized protein LOC111100125 [Crassostrea virginica]
MKQPSLSVVLFFISLLVGFVWPCFKEDLGVINNAFLKCSTNESCEAQCYPGYVFPNGETQRIYSCIPLLFIEYAAIWRFHNVIPNDCANITIRLNNSKSTTEEAFSKACKYLVPNFTVHVTFETVVFEVATVFSTEYTNYTKRTLNLCSDLLQIGFQNLRIGRVFDNITCENETANYTLSTGLHIRDEYEKCPKGMELRNISSNESVSENVKHTCAHSITRQALQWNPQGKRKVGRPRYTWRRSVQAEMEAAGYKWRDMVRLAQNRTRWRSVVGGLCTTSVPQA